MDWQFGTIKISIPIKDIARAILPTPVPGIPGGSDGKQSACNAGDQIRSLVWENPLEKGLASHSSILAWRISWTEKAGQL